MHIAILFATEVVLLKKMRVKMRLYPQKNLIPT
jgi:hypothetical protein